MKPTQASLYHPSMHTQSAAMRLTSLRQQRPDMSFLQFFTHRLRVVSSVSLRLKRTAARSAPLALDRRYGIHQLKCLGDIVNVSASQPYRQWNALSIGYDVMLATRLGPVRGIGTRFLPPKTARTEALSSTARVQSMRSAACRRSRHTRWIRSQTPASCQSLRRLQQVIPLPQPISLGRSSQPIPVLSTNSIPLRTCLSAILGLPPFGFGGSGGSNGRISSQNSSLTSGLDIRSSSSRDCPNSNPLY